MAMVCRSMPCSSRRPMPRSLTAVAYTRRVSCMKISRPKCAACSIPASPSSSSAGAAWAPTAEGVSLDVETFAAELPGLSIIGLFETTSLINIAGVNNVVIGGPQDYAIGGNEVEITVNNLAGLTAGDVEVTIGGQLATVSDVAGDVITAVVPRAADLAEPIRKRLSMFVLRSKVTLAAPVPAPPGRRRRQPSCTGPCRPRARRHLGA
mgnify:CR=1 FL=1